MLKSESFKQYAYTELPLHPVKKHGYEKSHGHTLQMEAPGFVKHKVHYRIIGKGPVLLLVHGLMTSSYSWRYVLESLAEQHTVIAVDLPGAGNTEPVEGSYSPLSLANWISAFQDKMNIVGCDAIGNSMGGYLCMWNALLRPYSFRKLINLHSPGLPRDNVKKLNLALSFLPLTLPAYLARRDPYKWVHKHIHYRDEGLKSQEEALAYGKPLSTKEGSMAFAKYLKETLSLSGIDDFKARLAQRKQAGQEFPVPLYLLYSNEDPMVPPDIGPELHALLPGSTFEWIENSSHFMHVDNPEETVTRCFNFLRA